MTKRDVTLYTYVQKKNMEWIRREMKRAGYTKTRGRSEFIDDILTKLRNKETK